MGCGEISVLDGGTIKNSTLVNSQMVNSTIQSSTFDGGSITNLTDIDAVSAQRIADAIAALTPEQLAALMLALAQKQTVVPAAAPATTEANSTPTEFHGDREIGMGAPDMWAKYSDDYIIPLYEKR